MQRVLSSFIKVCMWRCHNSAVLATHPVPVLAFYSTVVHCNISFRLDTFVIFHGIQKLLKQFSKAKSLPE